MAEGDDHAEGFSAREGERGGDSSRRSCASPGESSGRDGRHPRCSARKGRSADDEGKIEEELKQSAAKDELLAEQLRSGETEKTAAEAEMKRLRTQNEQWRKATEALDWRIPASGARHRWLERKRGSGTRLVFHVCVCLAISGRRKLRANKSWLGAPACAHTFLLFSSEKFKSIKICTQKRNKK